MTKTNETYTSLAHEIDTPLCQTSAIRAALEYILSLGDKKEINPALLKILQGTQHETSDIMQHVKKK